MHIFDIRRSDSVIDLWKRFGYQNPDSSGSTENVFATATDKPAKDLASATLPPTEDRAPLLTGYEAKLSNLARNSSPCLPQSSPLSPLVEARPPSPRNTSEGPQSLMAAFEAELATLMYPTYDFTSRDQQTSSPSEPSQRTSSSSQRTPHPVEVLAAQLLTHLANGANMVQSEFAARLPELQNQLREARGQLRDAQRTLPENVRISLQTLLSTIEAQMKIALGNLPDGGRQFAEDAIHAGRPVAENAADGFRMMASELNEFGKSLYAAFEEEFGRADSAFQNSRSENTIPTGVATSGAPYGLPASLVPSPHGADIRPEDSAKAVPVLGQPLPVVSNAMGARVIPSGTENLNQDAQATENFSFSSPHQDMRPSHPSAPPAHPGHWEGLRPPTFWPTLGHPPWNFPPDHSSRHSHHPPPHSRPPPPPPYPGRWPVPGSFGHLFTMKHYNHNESHQSSVASPEISSSDPNPQTDNSNKTLFIGNVGFNVSEKMIQDVFASKGFIVNVDLPLDTTSGKHAGFGYLHFPSRYPAMAAIDALQGALIDGYAINLELSDNAPIDNIYAASSLNVDSIQQARDHNKSEQAKFNPPSSRCGSVKRRKSVSFKEPLLRTEDTRDVRLLDVSPQQVDLSFEDTLGATRASSCQGEDSTKGDLVDGDERVPNFNLEKEMSRFPPVSQLEAQLLAKNDQDRTNPMSAHSPSESESPIQRPRTNSDVPLTRTLKRSSLEEMRLDTDRQGPSSLTEPSLRRSSTMMFPSSSVAGPVLSEHQTTSPRLSRCASERHSLRSNTETDTWARLDRRERCRSRPSSQHIIPGSFPVEETTQAPVPSSDNESGDIYTHDIENCVSSLIDMGYGTTEDGGRARMAVYAAASNGVLLDAIEMIEEERKVYAEHNKEHV